MTASRIDVHAHYLGGELGRRRAREEMVGAVPIPAWSVERAVEMMDRHRIATQILSVPAAIMGAPGEPGGPDDVRVAARSVNDEYAELLHELPERFGAFASVPLDHPDHALAEIENALDTLGLDGVTLPSNAGGRWLGHPDFEPVLAELARRKTPTFIHPADCPHIDEFSRGRSAALIEYPFDTARTVVDAICRGVFRRHPGLRLILAHCGGALPTLADRFSSLATTLGGSDDDVEVDEAHILAVLRGLYYEIALSGGPHMLLPTLETTTPDHVLFGSDWPMAGDAVVERNDERFQDFRRRHPSFDLDGLERDNATVLFPRLRSGAAV